MKRLKADIYNGIVRILTMLFLLTVPAAIGACSDDIDAEKSICPFMRFLNFPCPGCGLTKSMIHAYRCEFDTSLYYHLWGIPLILMAVILIIVQLYDMLGHHNYTEVILSQTVVWRTLAIFVVLTYVLRLCNNI